MSRLMVNGWLILSVDLLVLALTVGACVSLLAGNVVERQLATVARLSEPCIDHRNLVQSLARVCVAGPYMLVNEALIAHRQSDTGWSLTISTIIFAALWCLASGILSLEFVWQIAHLSL
ncbi:MAG: DUF6949 family protein [Rhizobiaceae bacterium]